jgi:hypothetical protein
MAVRGAGLSQLFCWISAELSRNVTTDKYQASKVIAERAAWQFVEGKHEKGVSSCPETVQNAERAD